MKKKVFQKWEIKRKESGDIVFNNLVKESYNIYDINNKHNELNGRFNDVNKIHSNYKNLKTITTGANNKEYALIVDYERDALIINRLTNETLELNSTDLSIYNYLKTYEGRANIYYYNNDNVIVIR